jgi:hypothetical protein
MLDPDKKIGKTYTPIELALEAARCRVADDFARFNRIYPILKDIRPVLETELMRKGLGMKPSPIEVLDKLLIPMHGSMSEGKTQTFWE